MPTVKKVRKKRTLSRASSNGEAVQAPALTLPTEDNIPPDQLSDSALLLYGRKAIGKTTLASQFPGSLTFMLERGRRNLRIRQVSPKGWEQFLEYKDLFIESEDYQHAIMDTIDKLYLFCFNYICYNAGIKHPDQSSKSYEVWDAIESEFTEAIYELQASGKGLIFLSHEKAKPLVVRTKPLRRDDDEEEEKIARMEPSCRPAGIRVVQEICDYVFYYCFVRNQRVMCVRSPNEYAWTACGLDDHFLDPEGNPIQRFLVGSSPVSSYQSLLDAYDNKLYDMDYTPPKKSRKKSE